MGRKTANIVLYHALGRNEGIAVDTHVRRLAQRIGFSDTDNVSVIERDLMALFPRDQWGDLTDLLIAHGRATCDAKKPRCSECVIPEYCRYYRDLKRYPARYTRALLPFPPGYRLWLPVAVRSHQATPMSGRKRAKSR